MVASLPSRWIFKYSSSMSVNLLMILPPLKRTSSLSFQVWENGCYHPHQHAAHEERGSRVHICHLLACHKWAPLTLTLITSYSKLVSRIPSIFSTEGFHHRSLSARMEDDRNT